MRNIGDVYAKAGTVCVGIYLANLTLERQFAPVIQNRALRWTTAFAILQIASILFISFYLLGLRAYQRLKENLYEQIRPAIRERVMAVALQGEAWSSKVPGRGPARHVLEESIAHALGGIKDSGRDRIAQFALEYGFVAHWVKSFSSHQRRDRRRAVFLLGLVSRVAGNTVIAAALHDKEPAVRTEAARALLVTGDSLSIDQVFRSLLQESLLARALLANDLKRHARFLLANTVPAILKESNQTDVVHCLEILISWKRALPFFDAESWLANRRDRLTWPLVLALLPYVPVDDSIANHLLLALNSGDLDVQCSAARAAGQLKQLELIPTLSLALNQNRQLALVSAAALAQMGRLGERNLEKTIGGPDRKAAAIAMEALEHLTVRP